MEASLSIAYWKSMGTLPRRSLGLKTKKNIVIYKDFEGIKQLVKCVRVLILKFKVSYKGSRLLFFC